MYLILKCIQGVCAGESFHIERGGCLTVGRSPGAEQRIPDEHLSRMHCALDFNSGERCKVMDMKSRNGVYLNGNRVEVAELRQGDRLALGQEVMVAAYVLSLNQEPVFEPASNDANRGERRSCEKCGMLITLATLAEGDVREREGRYLCPDCASIVDFEQDVFEGHQVLDRIGSGSVGFVYRARHLFTDRVVALKILRLREGISQKSVMRFLREAKTISQLDHPHIISIYDINEYRDGYYLVMEYFAGRNVQQIIEASGPMPIQDVVNISIQIATALSYAFSKKIVHRDIKPANILYSHDRVAKLMDFGLAKSLGMSSWHAITREGEGLGTPCYMPPEQVRDARKADQRSDIYSLGATLYHMLSGQFPVQARNYNEFITFILERDPVPLETLRTDAPPDVVAVVRKTMAKNPDHRYSVPEDLLADLLKIRDTHDIEICVSTS